MQTTLQLGQVQPSILSNMESVVKNCKKWLNAKSETFSVLCGESFTHKEVVLTHVGLVVFFIILGVAGAMEGGAL